MQISENKNFVFDRYEQTLTKILRLKGVSECLEMRASNTYICASKGLENKIRFFGP